MARRRKDQIWTFTPELMDDREILLQYRALSGMSERFFREAIRPKSGISFLERVTTEQDWREIRAHLTLFEASADRLDEEQIKVIINYLFDLLFHDNGTIRRLSAGTMGYILSLCMEDRPEIFEEILHRILFRSGKKSEYKRRWIGNTLKTILSVMFEQLNKNERKEALRIYASYFKSSRWGHLSCLNLLEGIMEIPWNSWSFMQRGYIFDFLRNFLKTPNDELREAALWLLDDWISDGWYCPPDVKSYLKHLTVPEDARICEHYLLAGIHYAAESGKLPDPSDRLNEALMDPELDYEVLFHEDLQSDHYWIYKVINLDILKRHFAGRDENALYRYATHLLNILRVNTQQEVFWRAGEDLVEIFPRILQHQKYEIISEIFKAIELRDDSSNYLPSFLGRTFPQLEIEKQKEFYPRIRLLADSRNTDTVKIIAETLCIIMTFMGERESENPRIGDFVREQRRYFLGILCRCMAGYKPDISVETFYLVGNVLCKDFSRIRWPHDSFLYFTRKTLIYMRDTPACHSKVYMLPVIRRITESLEQSRRTYKKQKTYAQNMKRRPDQDSAAALRAGQDYDRKNEKIAIFSDSFDPFSMGQRAVVQEAADSGYQVYLNVHNFFWAKNTQPLMIRRQMAAISIADIRGAYLLPADIPVNVNLPEDLKMISDLFPGKKIYLITGSDTAGASDAYLRQPEAYSIHHFPHIIYSKNEAYGYPDMRKIKKTIFGDIVYLKLPAIYDHMTPEDIRRSLAEGREIDGLADPQVQSMIRDWNLYSDTTPFKQVVEMDPVETKILEEEDGFRLVIMNAADGSEYASVRARRTEGSSGGQGVSLIIEAPQLMSDRLSAGSDSYENGRNERILKSGSLKEFVLQEMLAVCQERGYSRIVCRPDETDAALLKRSGFVPSKTGDAPGNIYYELNASEPLAMFFDAGSFFKEPYGKDPMVQKAVEAGRIRLKECLARLYPGSLVLHIDSGVLHYKINRMIHDRNTVTDEEAGLMDEGGPGESLGSKLCVPFGKIMKGIRIPNTVTKVLNAQKVYDEDMKHFDFRELPDYPSLPTQIRTIRSFGMPVILVDDVYHKGFRMEKMSELLTQENVDVSVVIVGVLSGRGKDLARRRNIEVEAAYYIPNMKAWLLESDMYPFIGGDGILGEPNKGQERNASPSINTLLPYQMPSFLKNVSDESVLDLSKVCLENARDIFRALEQAYRERYHRTLTFDRIKEVFSEPRYPDGIDLSEQALKRPVSEILTGELHRLARLYR